MKTTTITAASLAEQLKTAEAQSFTWRARRTKLQADLAGLRDQLRAEMHRALGNSGTSPELKAVRSRITETEVLVEQADQLIADGDQLVRELYDQLAAARTEEEKATHAAEVVRLSSIAELRIAELNAALEAAAKAGGAVVIALAELERLDKAAANRLGGAVRHLDTKPGLFDQGWKQVNFLYGAFAWIVQPLVPSVAGLDAYPGVGIKAYLAARDAAPGARQ